MGYYRDWLEGQHKEHSPELFRQWVDRGYRGGNCAGAIEVVGLILPGGKEVPLRATAQPEGDPVPNGFTRTPWPANRPVGVRVRCHNNSAKPWHFHPNPNAGVHAYWRVGTAEGVFFLQGRAGRFHARVEPGETIDLTLAIAPIRLPGPMQLQITMIEEQHCFFHEVAMDPVTLKLDVP
jgi:hypothetical protein